MNMGRTLPSVCLTLVKTCTETKTWLLAWAPLSCLCASYIHVWHQRQGQVLMLCRDDMQLLNWKLLGAVFASAPMERTLKSSRTWRRDHGSFTMRREAPSIAIPISTSFSSWLPSMWWWLSPAGSTMKVPTLKPSSVGAGLSSGSRWPPVGFVCCCTCGHWLLHSAVPPGSSLCEDLSRPLGSAGLEAAQGSLWTSGPGIWAVIGALCKAGIPCLTWVDLKGFLILKFKQHTNLSQKNWNFNQTDPER